VKAKQTQTKTKEKAMTTRADRRTQSPERFKIYVEFKNQAKEGAIEEKVRDLGAIRASKSNACAFCLNSFCLRNASALSLDRFSLSSLRTTAMNGDSPN
jgi:alkylhydroperoxidase family enzyme